MLKVLRFLAFLLAVGIAPSATAQTLRFTATSEQYGELGYLTYDSSAFNGTAYQFVDSSHLLSVSFHDPVSGVTVAVPAPLPGGGAWFDSAGHLPTPVGGGDFTGGSFETAGFTLTGANSVRFYNQGTVGGTFEDVNWSTTVLTDTAPVPEPSTWTMMLFGFGAMGVGIRKRKVAVLAQPLTLRR
jgi:hypothetical protein